MYEGALGRYEWPRPGGKEASNIRKDYNIPIYRYIGKNDMVG